MYVCVYIYISLSLSLSLSPFSLSLSISQSLPFCLYLPRSLTIFQSFFQSLFLSFFLSHPTLYFHSIPSHLSSSPLNNNLSPITSSLVLLPMCFLSSPIHPFHVSLLCFHSFPLVFSLSISSQIFPSPLLSLIPISHPLLPCFFPSITSLSSFDPCVQFFFQPMLSPSLQFFHVPLS